MTRPDSPDDDERGREDHCTDRDPDTTSFDRIGILARRARTRGDIVQGDISRGSITSTEAFPVGQWVSLSDHGTTPLVPPCELAEEDNIE